MTDRPKRRPGGHRLKARCTAKTRTGEPCKAHAIPPTTKCKNHGGLSPIKHGFETGAAKAAARGKAILFLDDDDQQAWDAVRREFDHEADHERRTVAMARLFQRRATKMLQEGRLDEAGFHAYSAKWVEIERRTLADIAARRGDGSAEQGAQEVTAVMPEPDPAEAGDAAGHGLEAAGEAEEAGGSPLP